MLGQIPGISPGKETIRSANFQLVLSCLKSVDSSEGLWVKRSASKRSMIRSWCLGEQRRVSVTRFQKVVVIAYRSGNKIHAFGSFDSVKRFLFFGVPSGVVRSFVQTGVLKRNDRLSKLTCHLHCFLTTQER